MKRVALFLALAIGCFLGSASADDFSGVVVDDASSAPITGAEIVVGNDSWPPVAIAFTDQTGAYLVTGLPAAADYTVLASAPGHSSMDFIMQEPPAIIDFRLVVPSEGLLVQTLNQGRRNYREAGHVCWRFDGVLRDSSQVFSGIDDSNPNIDALLADVGAGTDPPVDDAEVWFKAKTLWEWLLNNAIFSANDPTWQAAMNYLMEDGWPSVDRIASTWSIYGFVPWGTCMSRAQIHVTLMHRIGIPVDRVAIAETRWRLGYSQHMYTVLYIANRWIHVDPSAIALAMPPFDEFHSIPRGGSGYIDYRHPYALFPFPGSSLSAVPEITDRPSNNIEILVVTPPDGTDTIESGVRVSGWITDASATEVEINGRTASVASGGFDEWLNLACGTTSLVAEVTIGFSTFSDSVAIHRTCGPPHLFSDGFETGNSLAWTATVP